ncbi:MAG: VWA domain-containing protein [Polyangiaceae bacterium]
MRKLFSTILCAAIALGGLAAEARAGGNEATSELQQAIEAINAPATIKAIQDLGAQGDLRAAKLILQFALNIDQIKSGNKKFTPEESDQIFEASKAALIALKDPKAHKFVFDSLRSQRSPAAKMVLVEAIATKQGDDADAALLGALKDPVPSVVGLAIRSLASRKCKAAIEPIIGILARVERRRDEPWQDAQTALVSMSGMTDIVKAADWKSWWAGNKETFNPAAVRAVAHNAGDTAVRDAPKLFGTEVLSKRVIFILDVSGSMNIKDVAAGDGHPAQTFQPKDAGYSTAPLDRVRIVRLKTAMSACINALPEDTYFTIITFSSQIKAWQEKLVPATAENKQSAQEFANGMQPEGFTFTDKAFEKAFSIPDANTMYLFSDGVPDRGKGPTGADMYVPAAEMCSIIAQLNRVRKVKIYTIGIGEADPNLMSAIANANDGTFTPVK